MHKVLLLLLAHVLSTAVLAQKVVLKGKITDKSNAKGVDFVNMYIDSIYVATLSQNGGQYSLNNLEAGKYTLCASHLGYEKFRKEIDLNPGINVINIELLQSQDTISPIVITGTGTHYRIDNVPVQTEIITKKEITALSGKNVEEVISNISSSIDYTSSSMGTNIKVNGLGRDYVLILLDGKRLTGGVGGYADLSRINAEDIEQIEIVKGASSILYGSDAIAGVINIITKKPKQNLSFTNNSRLGEYGEFKQLNSLSFNKNKLFGKTTFNYKQKDGYQLNTLKFNSKWENNHDLPRLLPTHYKPVNKTRAYTLSQYFEYKLSEKFSLNLNASWYEKRLYFPFKAQMHNYYYNDISSSLGGKYKLRNKDFIDFSFSYTNYSYFKEYPWKYNESYITNKGNISVTYYPGDSFKNSEQKNINTQLKGVFHLRTKHVLSVGGEVMGEYLEAQYRLTTPDVKAFTYSIYGQDEYKFNKKVNLVTGLRAIYHSQVGFMLTPKFTAMYKEPKFTYRLSYSNGFKSPTLKELYYYYESERMGIYRLYLGNPDLEAQKSHYISFSTEYKIKKFSTGLLLYINRINNKIDYKLDSTSYEHSRRGIEETKKRYNIDQAQNIGFDWHFFLRIKRNLRLSGGYSYVDARNLTQNIRLNGVSEHSTNAKIVWTKKWDMYRLNITFSGIYRSDRFYQEEDLERTFAKPYQLFRITTNHSILRIKSFDLTAIAGIDNLFNYIDKSPYGSHYGTLNPGRTFFVGLNFKFDKKQNENI